MATSCPVWTSIATRAADSGSAWPSEDDPAAWPGWPNAVVMAVSAACCADGTRLVYTLSPPLRTVDEP